MDLRDQDHKNVFQERISILRDQGYRGFTINKVQGEWDGVQVAATTSHDAP